MRPLPSLLPLQWLRMSIAPARRLPRPRRPATIGGLVSWPLAHENLARGTRHLAGMARRVARSQRSSIRCARADATHGRVPTVLSTVAGTGFDPAPAMERKPWKFRAFVVLGLGR